MIDLNLVACADEMVVAIRKLLDSKTRETFDEAKEHIDGAVNQYQKWRESVLPIGKIAGPSSPRKKRGRVARIPTCHPEQKHVAHGLCQQCYSASLRVPKGQAHPWRQMQSQVPAEDVKFERMGDDQFAIPSRPHLAVAVKL